MELLGLPENEVFHGCGRVLIPRDISTLSPEQRNYLKRSVQNKGKQNIHKQNTWWNIQVYTIVHWSNGGYYTTGQTTKV